ncbi:MAG: tetratricopeptide repeat protein [PVC group bacterium]
MIRKSLIQNVFLAVFGLLLGMIALEAGLRVAARVVMWQRDRGASPSPGERGQFTILCVGESTTYCGDRSYAYPRQLEYILGEQHPGRGIRVINKGKPGCNSAYIARKLPEWLAEDQPDLVVAMMGINDSRERLAAYSAAGEEPGFWERLRLVKVLRFAGQNLGFILRSGIRTLTWNADDYVFAGMRLLEIGDDEEATRLFRRALERDPHCAAAHTGLARYYLHRQDFKKIMSECALALTHDPNNDRAMTVKGRACMEQSKWGEAAGYLEQALSINPLNDEALGALAWCYYWKQKRLQEAEDLALRALRSAPANHLANAALWSVYRKRGETGRALDVCLKAHEAEPLNDRYCAEIAQLYDELGAPESSETYRQKIESARLSAVNPMTVESYRKIREMCRERGILLVAVQYPMRSVEPIEKIVGPGEGVIVVDNELIFKEAVNRDSFQAYFKDNFAGDFGHCTAEGNRLLADNIARHIGPEMN